MQRDRASFLDIVEAARLALSYVDGVMKAAEFVLPNRRARRLTIGAWVGTVPTVRSESKRFCKGKST
ncbi:MAG: hypothetical protein SF339_17680 [Blastocatellia bacterium]|nr:hypothetical protein [Blastocatellia bacterium]